MRAVIPLIYALAALLFSTAPATAQNFTGLETYVQAAERARVRAARFWTGEALPDWSKPCSITVAYRDNSGGGSTRFTFYQGEVFGFRMELEGRNDQAILTSVLPHEVDHAVRASIVRRPVVRWAGEGCAALFESEADHERYRRQILKDLKEPKNPWKDFDASEYGRGNVMPLYSVGFSICEWLLSRPDGRRRMIAFQRDPRRPSEKLADHYGMTVREAYRAWHKWFQSRAASGYG